MEPRRNGGSAEPLDALRGSSASTETLRRNLRSAPTEFLVGALENPRLTPSEMLLLLRNRCAPAELLQRIGREPRWVRNHRVGRLLVEHPNTPRTVASRLVQQLFWNDLAEVARKPSTDPVVRRRAESLLLVRLEEMTVGERVALARIATRGVIPGLIEADDAPVLKSLLDNPRLIEADAARIARIPRAPATLDHLARYSTWGRRPAVRRALLRNPGTPIAAALHLLRRLDRRELLRICRDSEIRTVVRVGAERMLGAGADANEFGKPGQMR